jgi:hydrogenase maturation protein HypF
MGRLFDAVAAMAGVRNEVNYEAQAAIELECMSDAWLGEAQPYPYELSDGLIQVNPMFQQVIADVRHGRTAGLVGARLHLTVVAMALQACMDLRTTRGIGEVVLSGGVWQNQILHNRGRAALEQAGFTVYTHRQVPANDGGIALGQVVAANARVMA